MTRGQLFIVANALLVACSAGLPQPTPAHLSAAQQRDPNSTLDDLSRGRTLYAAKCGSCHALREPESLAPDGWKHEIEEMQQKQGVRLTSDESRDILRYLAAATEVAHR